MTTPLSSKVLLDLYEASFEVEWLQFAIELQETQDRLFFDEKNGGYFSTQRQRSEHPPADEGRQRRRGTGGEFDRGAESSAARAIPRRQAAARAREKNDRRFAATLSHFPAPCRRCWSRSIPA